MKAHILQSLCYLYQGDYVFGYNVCLFVCLPACLSSNTTHNNLNGLQCTFMEGFEVVKGISGYILVVI